MKLNSEDLRELYQRETSRSARSADDCLTEDVMIRAATGELTASERERAADHFATCSDCAKEYRAISSLKPWADESATSFGAHVIPMPVVGNGKGQAMAVARVGSRKLSFYLPYAVAAASLILALALGALLISKWRENQRLVAEVNNRQAAADAKTEAALAESRRLLEETNRRVEQESSARRAAEEELAKRDAAAKSASSTNQRSSALPEVNVPIIDLNPQDAGRGEQAPRATTIQLPRDTDLFTLILNLGSEDASSSYSLEVTDRNDRAVWTSHNLRKSPYNNFSVAMRRRSFPAGEYRLKIYGLRDGRRELVQEYAFRLAY